MRRLIAGSLILLGLSLLVVGFARPGGFGLVMQRVRTEVQNLRPRPDGVPTPLAELITPLAFLPVPTYTPTPSALLVSELGFVPELETERSPPPIETQSLPTPLPAVETLPASMALQGLTHMWQTWNNCGPATVAMQLSYFGSGLNQAQAAQFLKPNPDDKNVSPDELAAFARSQDYNARVAVNGNPEILRRLLSLGIPVIIETWHEEGANNGMGHYRLLIGYDDGAGHWIAYDSFDQTRLLNPDGPYAGIALPYGETEPLWRVFNRIYVAIYPADLAPQVNAIMGGDSQEATMWQQAAIQAQLEIQSGQEDGFAWFNLGSSLTGMGQYEQAAGAFDQARRLGLPWRMLWYQFAPFQAYYEMGRFSELLALADATLAYVDEVEELHYWRGRALLAQGNLSGARQAFEHAVALNPNFAPAIRALAELDR